VLADLQRLFVAQPLQHSVHAGANFERFHHSLLELVLLGEFGDLNPLGRVFYSVSTLVCTQASLAQEVGAALGAQAGEARLREVVTKAGFAHFRRATQTPFNFVFEVKDKSLPYSLNLAFRKPNVEKAEVIDALRDLLRRLESE